MTSHDDKYLGEEIEKDLVQLLQKKLDEAVLEQVWFMFERNKMCKLTQDDVTVHFIFTESCYSFDALLHDLYLFCSFCIYSLSRLHTANHQAL